MRGDGANLLGQHYVSLDTGIHYPKHKEKSHPMATNAFFLTSLSPAMASLTGAASHLLPSATIAATSASTMARLSLSFSSSSSSPSSLKCLGSFPLLPHIFRYQVSFSSPFVIFFFCFLVLKAIYNLQKRSLIETSSGRFSTLASPKCAASNPDQLKSAREDIKELLRTTFCHPILVIF